MKKNKDTFIAVIAIILIIFWIFFSMMPQWISKDDVTYSKFSEKRALLQVSKISEKPHFVGSENHKAVADYIEKELQNIGFETTIQEGTTLSDWGNLVKSRNILARIKGTNSSKALMLLSHYDSAPHSYSNGAADDGAGVAAILESLRAFNFNKTPHRNDIIVLFSDAEELGLNGAALFVTQHNWAKDIGLVLNFEARGTEGPSYMLMEVNNGNAKMVEAFSEADPDFPVANSLMYSIYKMLPNDTDLTVFREQGKIQGFNFAFIDGHYNYHTQQDDLDHLDPRSLDHQGEYLMPLLAYCADVDLSDLNSSDDQVYFSTPFGFFSYSFGLTFPILIVTVVLFLFIIFIGLGKRTLIITEIGRGFLNLFGTLILTGLTGYFGWKMLLAIYPQYNDILQGFTYNGHSYIFAFVFLSLAISFLFYNRRGNEQVVMSQAVAPLFLWIVINFLIALYLPGAGFFILPVLCAVFIMAYFVLTQRINIYISLFLCLPALVLFVPFIWMFPIGLGLKIVYGSAMLSVLVFGLLLPIFGCFPKKGLWSFAMFLVSICFMIHAHLNSDYRSGRAKPNSLVYFYDAEKDKALWATYDTNLDNWTKRYLGDTPGDAKELNASPLFSKYNTKFTYSAEAPIKELATPAIDFVMDSVIGAQRYYKIRITPNRKVNRYDIFADESLVLHNFKANGAKMIGQKGSAYARNGRKLLSYYVVNNEPLEMQFSINKNSPLNMELMESSFDLMSNRIFNMPGRPKAMMPKPFILNDAVIIRQRIKATPKIQQPIIIPPVDVRATDTIQAETQELLPNEEPEN
jgi:hypothetical protein